VLTIAISAEASPLLLPPDGTEPTVPVSLPNAELLIVEEPSVPPSHTEALSDWELTVRVSNENKSTPPVFESTATSLPTEGATPARLTSPPAEIARSSTTSALQPEMLVPAQPVKHSRVRRFALLGLVGLVIVALTSGIAWFAAHHASLAGRITEFPIPITSEGPSSSPVEITAGPDGNLWFTERGGNKIGRITSSGAITEFPLPTANSYLDRITAGSDGNLWFTEGSVTETHGNKIGRITPSGIVTEFPVPTVDSYLEGITKGPDGNLWFTEFDGNKIGRISPSGAITEFPVPTTQSYPVEITAGPDGNLWFTEYDGNKIGRITSGK